MIDAFIAGFVALLIVAVGIYSYFTAALLIKLYKFIRNSIVKGGVK